MNEEDDKKDFDADTIYKKMLLPIGSVNNPIFPYSFPKIEGNDDDDKTYFY
jgi:hypothetical protein